MNERGAHTQGRRSFRAGYLRELCRAEPTLIRRWALRPMIPMHSPTAISGEVMFQENCALLLVWCLGQHDISNMALKTSRFQHAK